MLDHLLAISKKFAQKPRNFCELNELKSFESDVMHHESFEASTTFKQKIFEAVQLIPIQSRKRRALNEALIASKADEGVSLEAVEEPWPLCRHKGLKKAATKIEISWDAKRSQFFLMS